MSASIRLVRSKFLQLVARAGDEFAAYHSLFGNLKRVNGRVASLLERFTEPTCPTELDADCQQAIAELQSLYYLVPARDNERDLLDRRLKERECMLTRGRLISALQLSISDACNFRCKYCFADRADHRSSARRRLKERPHKLMTLDTALEAARAVAEVIRRHGKDRMVIKFFGREPLVNWPVMKDLMATIQHGDSLGLRVRWDCTTNASLLTPEVADVLARYRTNLYVSVDSINEANDVNRPTSGGDDSFALIDRGIRLARERGIEVFVSAVLSSLNFDQFDDRLVDYAVDYGIKNVIVLLAMQNPYLMNQRTRTTDEVVDKLWSIYRSARSRGLNVAGYWHNPLRRLLLTTDQDVLIDKLEDHNSCTATGFQISVEPSGDIFPCRAQSLWLGHISDIDRMLHSEQYRWQTMRTYGNVAACQSCPIEGLCQGECLGHSEEMYDGDIYQPDPSFCEIYRGITRRTLELG